MAPLPTALRPVVEVVERPRMVVTSAWCSASRGGGSASAFGDYDGIGAGALNDGRAGVVSGDGSARATGDGGGAGTAVVSRGAMAKAEAVARMC